jgi:hypothetical protein
MRAESSPIDVGYDYCPFIENPSGGGSQGTLDLKSESYGYDGYSNLISFTDRRSKACYHSERRAPPRPRVATCLIEKTRVCRSIAELNCC